ncbi:hypothetical protein [Streptomyces pseudovenezuelae]|uniref:hypothetical protein n=1 Tax=Streptomyces pseudovenezuelae TaxID=67350 RepID=UPI002E3303E7|nr:hypothetical protein [Streptomyces pseudovenezuelae]WUA89646.1 hypothetical protein OHO81_21080 [Streptomyces pseudovenezuelae]
MRSARILLTTAAASAVLVLGAPGAFAAGDDWDSSDSSYSKEHTNPKYDPETYKDKDSEQGRESGGGGKHDGGGWSGSHEKPSGGMHTGGGGLASPAVTTGGLAMLMVAGTGLYAARRKRVAGSMA